MVSISNERTLCAELPRATPGQTVRLQGWVHRRRELAALTFLVVRDRTGLAQVVVKNGAEVPPEETTVERWTARLIEAANVREVTLFPRDLNRLTP